MKRHALLAVLLLAGLAAGGCQPRHGYYNEPYGRGYERQREMDDRDAWEIVRRDPCRYDEYRRYAEKHKNEDKRRAAVWKLAREGCSRPRAHDDRSDDYDRGYR